ncbi:MULTISPECIES: PIN-like domain-containing protein [unclassified Microbacterium]|uniref:PIN-like domain-containing protein n=1 Tax=unclassified Microbacterium TaxID=2609290 RepID=UPI000493189C|nr:MULTISPECIES: PIN domain-containing protein [unclassified Microbacterium]
MKSTFRGYYPPSRAELLTMWSEGLLVLDTNALLNLFRYSKSAREDFFKALRAKKDALWIPWQVGQEFHRRRIEIINHQTKAFESIEEALTRAHNQAESALNGYKRHPSLDVQPLRDDLKEAFESLIKKVKASAEGHRDTVVRRRTNESILTSITRLYEGRVGVAFDEAKLAEIYAEGATRYENKVPPGFADRNKDEPGRYGDLVLWKQLLVHASDVKLPAIFVTDDQKEDWWYTVDSERHGARPELVQEYFDAAGQRVHFMTSDRFLDFAKSQMVDISEESVNEAERFTRESARRALTARDREAEMDLDWRRRTSRSMPRERPMSIAERQRLLDRDVEFQRAQHQLRTAQTQASIARAALSDALANQAREPETAESAQRIIDAERRVLVAEREVVFAQEQMSEVFRKFDDSEGRRPSFHDDPRMPRRMRDILEPPLSPLDLPPLDEPIDASNQDPRHGTWRSRTVDENRVVIDWHPDENRDT